MKTQTAEEILEKNNITIATWIKPGFLNAMHDHTTTQIEALRERLRDVPEFFSYADEIDKVFNEFLKEIND